MAFDILLIILIVYVIVMVWNGLHGNGYKVAINLPNPETVKGKVARIAFFSACGLVLALTIIGNYQSPDNQKSSTPLKVIGLLIFIVGVATIGYLWVKRGDKWEEPVLNFLSFPQGRIIPIPTVSGTLND